MSQRKVRAAEGESQKIVGKKFRVYIPDEYTENFV